MAGAEALALDLLVGVEKRDGLTGLVVDRDTLGEGGAAPAAADHLVEVIPAGESVVRRVDVDESAAIHDEFREGVLHCGAPFRSVVVVHDDLVVRELRGPLFPFGGVGLLEGGFFGVPFLGRGVEGFLRGGVAGLGLGRLGLGEGGGSGGNGHGEATGGLEGGLGGLGRANPVVVITSVEHEDADFLGGSEGEGQEGEQADEPELVQGFHGESLIGGIS